MEQDEIKDMARKVREELQPTDAIQRERDRIDVGKYRMGNDGFIVEDRRPQTGKYIAHVNLNWLAAVFADKGINSQEERDKFLAELQDEIRNFIMSKEGVLMSYEWEGRDGNILRAIDLQPVLTSDTAPLFLTEEWWQMLKETLKTTDFTD